MSGEFGWAIGLHVVMAIWLGLLASAWKGRNARLWIGLGLCTSVVGLLLLARLPRVVSLDGDLESEMQLQHMDGTSLL